MDTNEPLDIFNMDETGLIYCASQNKTFHMKGGEAAGGKQSSQKVSLLCYVPL